MGASKNGGYQKLDVQTAEQSPILKQLLALSGQNLGGGQGGGNLSENPLYKQAASAIQGFLPGGQGFAPIQQEAQQNFQQSTIPSILNAFGQGNKGSSSLNQALAGAGQNLNTSLASQLAQMQLGAAGQAANLAGQPGQQGLQQASLGLGTPGFGYAPKQNSFLQDLLLGSITAGSEVGKQVIASKFGR